MRVSTPIIKFFWCFTNSINQPGFSHQKSYLSKIKDFINEPQLQLNFYDLLTFNCFIFWKFILILIFLFLFQLYVELTCDVHQGNELQLVSTEVLLIHEDPNGKRDKAEGEFVILWCFSMFWMRQTEIEKTFRLKIDFEWKLQTKVACF